MSFSRIYLWMSIITLIPPLIPTALTIPKIGASPKSNPNVRTTTIVSSSTTTFLAISTEYSTPAGNPAASETPPPTGPPWATKPWFPPTYSWKDSETMVTTSSFYPTPANMSSRYSTHTGRPLSTQLPSPQIRGREVHPSWNSRWCLAVRTKVFADGTPVGIGRCNKSLEEYWEFKTSPGRTKLRVAGTNFCLKGEIDSTVRIKTCNDEIPSQDWYVTQDDRFALRGSGKCLERPNGGLSEGMPALVYKCTDNNTNQIWTS